MFPAALWQSNTMLMSGSIPVAGRASDFPARNIDLGRLHSLIPSVFSTSEDYTLPSALPLQSHLLTTEELLGESGGFPVIYSGMLVPFANMAQSYS
jgi:hypothetical protein